MAKKEETKIQDKIRATKRAWNFNNLLGQKFNKLTVLELYSTEKETIWKCKCDCGNITFVSASHLKDGHTKSCGCQKNGFKGKDNPSYKHGLRHSRIYGIWVNMKTRCLNSNNDSYKSYGARGIKICDKWLDKENGFINFYNWAINNGYKDNLTIDRIDVNGNYEPSNCRWVGWETQQNNRRTNFVIEYNGIKHTLQEWSRILPIKIESSLLRYRILNGWAVEKAFTTPVDRRKNRWKK